MPFDPHDPNDLLQHYADHGHQFGATTAQEYEEMADNFMTRPIIPPMREHLRANGMRVRYDPSTDEFGVLYTWGYVATYFKPIPAPNIPVNQRTREMHGYRTNMQYFTAQCW